MLHPVAWRPLAALAGAVAAALVATAGRYGYHRDELYFLRAGRELAWGYPDQPPLTPLLARVADELVPGSLVGLRVPSALVVAALVLVTGVLTRDLGGDRRAQALAAACTAVSAVVVITGHLLSTTTVDLLVWALLSLLAVRLLRGGDPRLWLAAGLVCGVGLLNKQLVAAFAAALVMAVLLAGPRGVLRSRWVVAGALVAVALWTPHLLWQAAHGWPALAVASSVAAWASTSSEPPVLFLPFQLLLVSPVLVPVWVAGLVRLWRDPALRSLPVAYALLAVLFLVTGGKPYYLAGLYPLLLAAGALGAVGWARTAVRRAALGTALALSAAVSAVLGLPLVPVDALASTPVTELNEDAGETAGWPALVRTVADVARDTGPSVVLTANYGQAGAVDRFGPELGLPEAHSGHNGYADWGPPTERDLPVVAVGLRPDDLDRWFGTCRLAARVDNGVGLDNEEQGTAVHVCEDRRRTWAELWPDVRRLG